MTIVFSEDDLRLFSKASGDCNPLHLSASYARATSFGRPVVFGALGALAALSGLKGNERLRIAKLSADFHRPMFTGVAYRIVRTEQRDATLIRLFDGSVNVLSVAMTLKEQPNQVFKTWQRTDALTRLPECKTLSWREIIESKESTDIYTADADSAKQLLETFGISDLPAEVAIGLLWSSYFVGTELPGERALFFRCVLKFAAQFETAEDAGHLNFSARLQSANESLQQIRVAGQMRSGDSMIFSADLVAFFRPVVEVSVEDDIATAPSESDKASGKVAVVIGASRGLGAAISARLAGSGADVIACARSNVTWVNSLNQEIRDRVHTELLDAADTNALGAFRSRLEQTFGRLDYLVCNAFPPIPSLRIEINAFDRIKSYVNDSLVLTLGPMCALLGLLNQSGGTLVVVSSSAVSEPVRDWPHYIAAKSAAESLAEVAAMQYEAIGVLVVRPDRMLTDMTNTPMGRSNAPRPGKTAELTVKKMLSREPSSKYEVITFEADDLSLESRDSEVLVTK